MAEWVTVARTDDLPEGEMIRARSAGGERRRSVLRDRHELEVLVANVDGRYCAIGSVCTHEGGPLSDGDLYGSTVTCPWHGSEFSVETGEVEMPPAAEPVPVYEVRVEGDEIQVAEPEATTPV
jgi:nitrite reductase/ring-hydroxylating ferredoxin subunit